jgi:hypothetical protein
LGHGPSGLRLGCCTQVTARRKPPLEPSDMEDQTSGKIGSHGFSRIRRVWLAGRGFSGLTGCGFKPLGSADRRLWLCRRRPSTTHREPDPEWSDFPPASSGLPLTDPLSPDLTLTLSSLFSSLVSQSHSLVSVSLLSAPSLFSGRRRKKKGRRTEKKERRKRRSVVRL